MQKSLTIFLIVILSVAGIFWGCKKEKVVVSNPPPLAVNKPPVANAGADISISRTSCGDYFDVRLDGSRSSDPETNIVSYRWRITATTDSSWNNWSSAKLVPYIQLTSAGQYTFELTVTDAGGLTATDIVQVTATDNVTPQEYNLDINTNSSFTFTDNYCERDYYYSSCDYYDYTSSEGTTNISPLGDFNFRIEEYADTASTSEVHYTSFSIYRDSDHKSIYGTLSVNLKKLIQSGGGAFTGTYTIIGGSAKNCNPTIFDGLAPLTVTGTVTVTGGSANTKTGTINMNVKGRTYF